MLRPKDKLEDGKKAGVIYQIPWLLYCLGETGRSLHTRTTEHQRNVRLNKTDKFALSEHAITMRYNIDWDEIKSLKNETRWY